MTIIFHDLLPVERSKQLSGTCGLFYTSTLAALPGRVNFNAHVPEIAHKLLDTLVTYFALLDHARW